jgi:uncharacterized protein YukE
MKSEIYATLTEKERMMYDEMVGFAKRLAERQEETNALLKKILEEASA